MEFRRPCNPLPLIEAKHADYMLYTVLGVAGGQAFHVVNVCFLPTCAAPNCNIWDKQDVVPCWQLQPSPDWIRRLCCHALFLPLRTTASRKPELSQSGKMDVVSIGHKKPIYSQWLQEVTGVYMPHDHSMHRYQQDHCQLPGFQCCGTGYYFHGEDCG